MKIEAHITSVIEGEVDAPMTRGLLQVMSGAFYIGSTLHRGINTLLPKARLSAPVISVGSIVAGGCGKTPLVAYLARALAPKQVAILTRGYRRKGHTTLLVKSDTPVERSGDEPKWLKEMLPDAHVIVGRSRAASGRLAEGLGAEVHLLDDGLQHHTLHRDREIIALDAENWLGGGRYLPSGYLRQSPRVLSKADLLVLSGFQDRAALDALKEQLRAWTDAPLVAMGKRFPNRAAVCNRKIGALCAIAQPRRFFRCLREMGCTILHRAVKVDHEPFSEPELAAIADQAKCRGAELLVCTEKDAVKWPRAPMLSLPLIPLQMQIEPLLGAEYLEHLIHGVHS